MSNAWTAFTELHMPFKALDPLVGSVGGRLLKQESDTMNRRNDEVEAAKKQKQVDAAADEAVKAKTPAPDSIDVVAATNTAQTEIRKKNRGRSATMLTGGRGLTSDAGASRKVLLST